MKEKSDVFNQEEIKTKLIAFFNKELDAKGTLIYCHRGWLMENSTDSALTRLGFVEFLKNLKLSQLLSDAQSPEKIEQETNAGVQ